MGRREAVLALTGGLAVVAPLVGSAAAQTDAPPSRQLPRRSKALVAIARREGLLRQDRSLDEGLLRDALAAAIARAAGERTTGDALRRLFRPSDTVGIKVNCIAGAGLSSRPEIALELARLLQGVGVAPDRIVIWDRTDRELRSAGYRPPGGAGVRVIGTDGDYENQVREWGPGASRFARLLVEEMTALVDLAVLKDHGLAGVSLGLKNWYGAVHNPNKLHGDACTPYIPHLANSPLIRDKLRLTLIDATTGQCHGGPSHNPQWTFAYGAILASTDPVAGDAVGWQIIEAQRKRVGLGTLASEGREPRHIGEAARLGLGEADAARIEVAPV
jgi:uncharacterized protein (DUF362 family)